MSDQIFNNIALDTSFIEAQNFLAGKLLYDLADLGAKKYASIYITDIVYREVLARFASRVNEEDSKIKQVKKTIASSLRVLKNFDDYQNYFTLPTLDEDQVINEFKEKFDQWISKSNLTIIPTDDLTIGKVFKDYFDNKPPFSQGEKKHEFPDAFSFLALQDYFTKKKRKCLFVTHDKDFNGMETKNIFPVQEVSQEIDRILSHEKQSETYTLIRRGFDQNKANLEKQARDIVFAFIEMEVEATSEIRGMWIDSLDNIDLSDVEFTSSQTVFIGEGKARIEVDGNFAYEIMITVEDNSEAMYDREDGRYYGTEYRTIKIKDQKEEKFSVSVDFDLDENYVEIEVEDLNDGNGFKIFNHEEDYY